MKVFLLFCFLFHLKLFSGAALGEELKTVFYETRLATRLMIDSERRLFLQNSKGVINKDPLLEGKAVRYMEISSGSDLEEISKLKKRFPFLELSNSHAHDFFSFVATDDKLYAIWDEGTLKEIAQFKAEEKIEVFAYPSSYPANAGTYRVVVHQNSTTGVKTAILVRKNGQFTVFPSIEVMDHFGVFFKQNSSVLQIRFQKSPRTYDDRYAYVGETMRTIPQTVGEQFFGSSEFNIKAHYPLFISGASQISDADTKRWAIEITRVTSRNEINHATPPPSIYIRNKEELSSLARALEEINSDPDLPQTALIFEYLRIKSARDEKVVYWIKESRYMQSLAKQKAFYLAVPLKEDGYKVYCLGPDKEVNLEYLISGNDCESLLSFKAETQTQTPSAQSGLNN